MRRRACRTKRQRPRSAHARENVPNRGRHADPRDWAQSGSQSGLPLWTPRRKPPRATLQAGGHRFDPGRLHSGEAPAWQRLLGRGCRFRRRPRTALGSVWMQGRLREPSPPTGPGPPPPGKCVIAQGAGASRDTVKAVPNAPPNTAPTAWTARLLLPQSGRLSSRACTTGSRSTPPLERPSSFGLRATAAARCGQRAQQPAEGVRGAREVGTESGGVHAPV